MHGKVIQSIKLFGKHVNLCVSVFLTDMSSSSLGVRPGGFLCRHKIILLHKHHNLGIRRKFGKTYSEKSILFLKLFGKIDFQVHKNLKNRFVF